MLSKSQSRLSCTKYAIHMQTPINAQTMHIVHPFMSISQSFAQTQVT